MLKQRFTVQGLSIEATWDAPDALLLAFEGHYTGKPSGEISDFLRDSLKGEGGSRARVMECHLEEMDEISSSFMGALGLWLHQVRPDLEQIRFHYEAGSPFQRSLRRILESVVRAEKVQGGSAVEFVEVAGAK